MDLRHKALLVVVLCILESVYLHDPISYFLCTLSSSAYFCFNIPYPAVSCGYSTLASAPYRACQEVSALEHASNFSYSLFSNRDDGPSSASINLLLYLAYSFFDWLFIS